MAYSSSNTHSLTLSFLLLLSLTITLSSANPSMKVTTDELNQLCSKTRNPSFCMQILQSDPGTSTADLKGLATISIDIAEKNGTGTLNLIKSLAQQATDPQLKERYATCSDQYTSAIGNLDKAKQDVGSGNYIGLGSSASSSQDAASDCDDAFEAPPSAPSSLSKGNDDMKNLCNIVFNIAGMLSSGSV